MKSLKILVMLVLIASGCAKEKDPTAVLDLAVVAGDQSIMESEFNALFETVDGALEQNNFYKSPGDALPLCAVFTHDTVLKRVTIDFGNENCLCRDGNFRRGRIEVNYTDRRRVKGAVTTLNLVDFFVNDRRLTGVKTITNLGDSAGFPAFSFEVKDASLDFGDGAIRSWNRSAIVERIEGSNTPELADDVLRVRGTSNGTTRRGVKYSTTTIEPLIKKLSVGCIKNFVSGWLEIKDDLGNTVLLNYDPIGGAPCDKIAEVTVNGGPPRRIMLR